MVETLFLALQTLLQSAISAFVGLAVLLGFPAQTPDQEPAQPPIVVSELPSSASTTTSPASLEETMTPSAEPNEEAVPDPAPTPPPEKPKETTPAPEPAPEPPQALSNAELNERARAALVNVFCTSTGGSGLSATGSGVVIDPRGVILTNAHLAQYLFLEEDPGLVNCRIRTGGPARAAYDVDLLYVSPFWIKENASAITEREPIGTGEHDFALLRVTESITNDALPDPFSFVPLNMSEVVAQPGAEVFLAGYPAGFLGSEVIHRELYPSSAESQIIKLFTFNEHTIDVFALAGTILAQRGSSGAGVLDARTGTLIGIVVTSSVEESTEDRTLNAATIAHINRSLLQDVGISLPEYLSADLETRAANFQDAVVPTLRELLLREIE